MTLLQLKERLDAVPADYNKCDVVISTRTSLGVGTFDIKTVEYGENLIDEKIVHLTTEIQAVI